MVDGIGLVLLNTDDGAVDIQCFHQDFDTDDDFFSVFEHQLVVASQVGFALYAVDNQHLRFLTGRRQQFDLRREACATEADDTCGSHLVHNLFGFERAVAFDSVGAVDGLKPFVALHIHKDSRHTQAPSVGSSIDFGDRTAEGCVYVGTHKAPCFGDEFAYFDFLSFLDYGLGRCAYMLYQRYDSLGGQRALRNRLVCGVYFIVVRMYSAYSECVHALTSSCLGVAVVGCAVWGVAGWGSAGLRGGKLTAWIAPVGHSASHLRQSRHLV